MANGVRHREISQESDRGSSQPRAEPVKAGNDVRPHHFINRELSWLEFNGRVLEEACDPDVPLAERCKFQGIVASNLDEFFMVRVAGLKQLLAGGVADSGADGMLPG